MDILKQLFERHFHAPADQVKPLQGKLGGSGRKIIRLSRVGNSARSEFCTTYVKRMSRSSNFRATFARHDLPVPEIYG